MTLKLARNAMATRFELVLHGDDEVRLRAAGEEALDEVERLEAELSLYISSSQIARVNARAAREAVRVTPPVFALLQQIKRLHQETEGAFDPTIAPLVRCWGFMGATGHWPEPAEVVQARQKIGMHRVRLNELDYSVRFESEGMMIDLGAIGKGYAVDRAVELLREAGVSSALLHGGTSTVYALGKPPEGDSWKIAIEGPPDQGRWRSALVEPPIAPATEPEQTAKPLIATIKLIDQALSVSAVWGRAFEHQGKTFGHVLDPRTGEPVTGAILSAVALASAAESDALSTALLVIGAEGHDRIAGLRPQMRTVLVVPEGEKLRVEQKFNS